MSSYVEDQQPEYLAVQAEGQSEQQQQQQPQDEPRLKPMGSNPSLHEFDHEQQSQPARPASAEASDQVAAANAANASQKKAQLDKHHKLQLQKLTQKHDEESQLAEMMRDYLKRRNDINSQWAKELDKLNKQFTQKSYALAQSSVVVHDQSDAKGPRNRMSVNASPVPDASPATTPLPTVDESQAATKKGSKPQVEPVFQAHKAFHAVLSESDKVVKIRQLVDERTTKEVTDKIRDLNKEKQLRSKKLNENLQKVQVDLAREQAEYERLKKAYEDAQTYHASQRSKLSAEENNKGGKGLSGLFSSKDDRIKKYKQKVADSTQKLNQSRDDYLLQMDVLNAIHSYYYASTLPNYIRAVDGDYFKQVQQYMTAASEAESQFANVVAEGAAVVLNKAQAIDRDAEYGLFLQANRNTQLPQPIVFYFSPHGDDSMANYIVVNDMQRTELNQKMILLQNQQNEAEMQIEINESNGVEGTVELNKFNIDLAKASVQIKRLVGAGIKIQDVPKPQRPVKVVQPAVVEQPASADDAPPIPPQASKQEIGFLAQDSMITPSIDVEITQNGDDVLPANPHSDKSSIAEEVTDVAGMQSNFQKVSLVPDSVHNDSPLEQSSGPVELTLVGHDEPAAASVQDSGPKILNFAPLIFRGKEYVRSLSAHIGNSENGELSYEYGSVVCVTSKNTGSDDWWQGYVCKLKSGVPVGQDGEVGQFQIDPFQVYQVPEDVHMDESDFEDGKPAQAPLNGQPVFEAPPAPEVLYEAPQESYNAPASQEPLVVPVSHASHVVPEPASVDAENVAKVSQATLNEPAATQNQDIVKAAYAYTPQLPIELEFAEGDEILITSRQVPDDAENNWYEGKNLRTGQQGQFPKAYVSPA